MKRDIILKIYNYQLELALFPIIVVAKLHCIISTSLKWHRPNAKSTQRYANIIQRPVMPYVYSNKYIQYISINYYLYGVAAHSREEHTHTRTLAPSCLHDQHAMHPYFTVYACVDA